MNKNEIEKFEYALKFIQNTEKSHSEKLSELQKVFNLGNNYKAKDVDCLIDYVNDRNVLINHMFDLINDMISVNKNEEF